MIPAPGESDSSRPASPRLARGSAVVADSSGPPEFPLHVLREYALLADGERGVLVGPRGDFVWMCAPRWDSDAVFSSLIGGGGMYAVTPAEHRFVWGGYYEARLADLAQPLGHHDRGHRVPGGAGLPRGPHTAVVLRRVDGHRRRRPVRVLLDARAGFGAARAERLSQHEAACGPPEPGRCTCAGRPERGRAAGPAAGCRPNVTVPAGGHHDLVLEISDRPLDRPAARAAGVGGHRGRLGARRSRLDDTLADRDARHAYAVLRGLTSAGGGMVAAATMSPARTGRRPAATTTTGTPGSATSATPARRWPRPGRTRCSTTPSASSPPASSPTGRTSSRPTRSTAARCPTSACSHLAGYPGGYDKVGNWVNRQFQLDAFGETLLLFAAAARHDQLDPDHWQAVEAAVAAIENALARARRRHLGARQPALGPLPADVRRRTAGHRRRGARGAAAGWSALADAIWSPTSPPTACTRPAAGSAPPTTSGSTPPCCCPPSAARFRPTTRAAWPPSPRSRRTGPGRVRLPVPPRRAPAGRGRRRVPAVRVRDGPGRSTSTAARSRRPAGSNATGPPAAPPGCSPRSSTSASASCAATSPRRSCTRSCSNRPTGWPPRGPHTAGRDGLTDYERNCTMSSEHTARSSWSPEPAAASAGPPPRPSAPAGPRSRCWPAARTGLAGAAGTSRPPAARRCRSRPTWPTPTRSRPPPTRPRAARADRRVGQRRVHLGVRAVHEITARRVQAGHRGQLPGLRLRHHGRAEADAAPRPRHHRPGRLRAGLPRHPAADRLLRRQARHPGLPRVAALRAAARPQQRARHDGADAGGQHPAVRLGAVPAAQARPAGAADLPARGRRPRRPLRRRPPAAAGVLGRRQHHGHPGRQRRSPPACSTATWPGPGSIPADDRPERRTARSTCGSPPTARTATTTPPTAASTTAPSRRSPQLWASQHHGLVARPLLGLAGAAGVAASALGRRARR